MRKSQAAPEPRTMTPEKPHAQASSSVTTPISTLRCLKMRLSVSSALDVVADFEERIAEGVDVGDKLGRQVLMHAAGPEIGGMHAAAARPLVEHHQLLALLEAPERRRQRADIHAPAW